MSIKNLKRTHEAAQSKKLQRLGATGSLKMAKRGENAPRKYRAAGGSAGDDSPGDIEGALAKTNLGRPGRGKKGKTAKKGGTNVNVIIMPKEGNASPPPPMMAPMGGPAGMPPMPPHPMPGPGPGPMMGPPGAGGPPLPMHKHGGRVHAKHHAHGGKVHPDEVQDKKLVKRMVKGACLKK